MPSEIMAGSLERFSPLLKAGPQNTTKKNILELDQIKSVLVGRKFFSLTEMGRKGENGGPWETGSSRVGCTGTFHPNVKDRWECVISDG